MEGGSVELREVCAALQPPGGCWCGGTKMVEGIKTAVLRRYLLSLWFRGLSRHFYGNYYFRWKILPGWWTKFPVPSPSPYRNQTFRDGREAAWSSAFLFFFFHCSLESRGNFGNYFVHAAQFASRNKKYELTYLIRFLLLNFAIVL